MSAGEDLLRRGSASRRKITHPALTTADSVREWFRQLTLAGISFHPDDSFAGICEDGGGGERVFTDPEAQCMDESMAVVFGMVDDPSKVALEVTASVELEVAIAAAAWQSATPDEVRQHVASGDYLTAHRMAEIEAEAHRLVGREAEAATCDKVATAVLVLVDEVAP